MNYKDYILTTLISILTIYKHITAQLTIQIQLLTLTTLVFLLTVDTIISIITHHYN